MNEAHRIVSYTYVQVYFVYMYVNMYTRITKKPNPILVFLMQY